MADITLAAGIRASTTYEYFSNKDEVVWAILGDLFTSSAVRAEIIARLRARPSR